MADLTDTIASNSKIQDLQRELDHLNNYVSGPKFLYDLNSKVYPLDAGAYYDPTLNDKEKRRKYLQERIKDLTEQMKRNFKPLKTQVKDLKFQVQNFKNLNKEETNSFIGRSYYYPVGKNSPPAVAEKDPSFKPKGARIVPAEIPKSKSEPPQMERRVKEGQFVHFTTVSSSHPESAREQKPQGSEINPMHSGQNPIIHNAPHDPKIQQPRNEMPTHLQTRKNNLKEEKKSKVEENNEQAKNKKEEKKSEEAKPKDKKTENPKTKDVKEKKVESKVQKEEVKPKNEQKKPKQEEKIIEEKKDKKAKRVKKSEETKKEKKDLKKEVNDKVEKPKKKEIKEEEEDEEDENKDKKEKEKKIEKKEENEETKAHESKRVDLKKMEKPVMKGERKAEAKCKHPQEAPKRVEAETHEKKHQHHASHRLHTQGLKYETVKIVH